jgi:hypothetical protein
MQQDHPRLVQADTGSHLRYARRWCMILQLIVARLTSLQPLALAANYTGAQRQALLDSFCGSACGQTYDTYVPLSPCLRLSGSFAAISLMS